jgi:hypothetical protein
MMHCYRIWESSGELNLKELYEKLKTLVLSGRIVEHGRNYPTMNLNPWDMWNTEVV